MSGELDPTTLTWAEVDPARHPFAPDDAFAIAKPLIPRAHPDAVNWETQITIALVARYGRWAAGWRWAGDEGSIGGGPVHAWCCPQHSLSTPPETAARVQAALADWRTWIETLAGRFAALAPQGSHDRKAAFERAVPALVADVVTRTAAGDAWYAHCAQILSWYLEREGVDGGAARPLVEAAIGGRFESWVEPEPSLVADVSRRVAEAAPTR